MKRYLALARAMATVILNKYLVGLAAVGLIGSLLMTSSNRKIAEHARVLLKFEQAKTANHDLNENILRLKTFVLRSFDPLVRDLAVLQDICHSMKTEADLEVLHEPELIENLTNYCQEVENKNKLVERYKSEHSILRNSLSYLPLLVSQLKRTRYAYASHRLLANILLYGFEVGKIEGDNLRREINSFEMSQASRQEREIINSLKFHATSVLTHWQSRQDIEQKVLSMDMTKKFEAFEAGYIQQYQARQWHALIFQYLLAALCLGLMAWLAYIFHHLNDTKDRLQDLNANLEQKVSVRTGELSKALTQLESNQQLLSQSAKMTALGEMAGGIAHEINTPLAAITMNAGDILENIEESNPEVTKKRVESILKIVERVSKIIMGLRRFSRSGESTPRSPISIQSIVEDTLSLCAEKMKANAVDIQVSVPDGLMLNCVPEQISQVLLNFLNNSLDALKTSTTEDPRWIRISAVPQEQGVEISVTDAGLGLPLTVQSKLMQPFFTTKPPGMGTGLGLSISRTIVEEHGGELLYDRSSPNTRFVMRFHKAA